jgi:phenylalanyl-tRNA synthetase beta chain
MRVPLGWLREVVDVEPGATGEDVAATLVRVGLEEEALHGGDLTGPLVVGRVLSAEPEPQKNGKTIRWCSIDVGEEQPRGVVCGAANIAAGALVVVALPGAVLPGPFPIAARKTYGHVSDGMVASARELGLGDDHEGIIVLHELLGAAADELVAGQDALALLGLDEQVVEVNVTPDRGYCFSVRGLGREYAHGARLDVAAAYRDPAAVPVPAATPDGGWPVRLADDAPLGLAPGCTRFATRVVRGLDPAAPSPFWLRRRLQQAGMRPISLAVDVTNHVMLATGQPLHAYDAAALQGPLVVRRAAPGERLRTLDGADRALHPEDLLITDSPGGRAGARAIGLAGTMGGAETEVGPTTTAVVIEAARFDPVSVARTARRHRLPSEASRRFERGVDPELAPAAAELAVRLLVEHGGGVAEPAAGDVVMAHRSAEAARILLPAGLVADVVGVEVPRATTAELLEQVGCAVADDGAGGDLEVVPPTWRPDLAQAVDLVEEVARLHGYEHIPSVLPLAPVGAGPTDQQRARRSVARALAAAGCVEVLSYPFTSAERADQLGLPPDDPRRVALRLANPLSEEQPLLRTSLLATLVDAVRRNLGRGGDAVLGGSLAVFEVGRVTLPGGPLPPAPDLGVDGRPGDDELAALEAAVPEQPVHLAAVLTGHREPAGWWGPGRAADHTDALELGLLAAEVLGVALEVRQAERAPWHPGRCAALVLPGTGADEGDGERVVGHAGELHPAVTAALELPARAVAVELDLDALVAAAPGAARARPVPTYPVAKEDLALVAPAQVPAEDLRRALLAGVRAAGLGALVEDVRLFDVYTGAQVPPGHRSLAFALRLRAPDRTLTAAETAAVREAALAGAASLGAVLRS